MKSRVVSLFAALPVLAAALPPAHAQDTTAAITLTDDLKPNPLRFTGQIAAPVQLKNTGLPLNRRNDKCRYIEYAKVPSAPQVVLTLEKAKQISIVAMPDYSMNPAAYVVAEDRSYHYCVDSLGRGINFNLNAGRWLVYFIPRSGSGKYAFKLGDESRPYSVADAPAGTPSLTVEAAFKPNPQVFRLDLAAPGALVSDGAFGVRCGDSVKIGEQPSFTLELKADHSQKPLRLYSSHDFIFFDKQKGKALCVFGEGGKLALSAGAHQAYAIRKAYRGVRGREGPAWVAVRDMSRPLQYVVAPSGSNTTSVPTKLDKPIVITGTANAPRKLHPMIQDHCRHVADAADFFIQTQGLVEDPEIELLGTTGRVRLVGPIEADGSLKVAANARRDDIRNAILCMESRGVYRARGNKLDGLYAVYVATEGTEPADYALRILQRKTPREPFARALQPRAGLSLAERELTRWYPDLRLEYKFTPEWMESVHKLWMEVPKELIAFVKNDVEALKLKANTPVLVLRTRGEYRVLAANGRKYTVKEKDLATSPGGSLASPEPWTFNIGESDLPKFLDEGAVEGFLARQKKYNACYDKVLAKLDPDGRASRMDIITYRRGRIVKVEGMAARNRRVADKRCKAKAYDKYVAKLAKKAGATHERREQARLDAVKARVEGLK